MGQLRAGVVAVVASLLLSAVAADAGDPPATVQVTVKPETTRPLRTYKGHERQVLRQTEVRLRNEAASYSLRVMAGHDPAIPERAFPVEGYLGMPGPTSCNWYHGGFLWVLLNGEDVGEVPLSGVMATEEGSRGMVDMVWHHPRADVRIRFVMVPGDDALYAEIALDPSAPLAEVGVRLRCYPSFFTSHHKRHGLRRVCTPGARVAEGESVELPVPENRWALMLDEVFDVALGEGAGPCGVFIHGSDARTVRHAPESYPVTSHLVYSPATRSIRLAFWDFHGLTNAAALGGMPARAARASAFLDAADLTPPAVAGFDPLRLAEMRALATQAAAAAPDPAARLQGLVREIAEALQRQDRSVSAQENLLRRIPEAEVLLWQVKLSGLLGEL
ncbi:MAG: hypothetical protein JXR77_03710 [Lentisphaeria bacterium]|nr:hypothetical protein [Lentisphaeria bacterium]